MEQKILHAVMNGDIVLVQQLLEEDGTLVNTYSEDGWGVLHLAAYFGHTKMMEFLLSQGAPIDARSTNDMKNTPLHAATANKQQEAVALLLANGADVHAKQSGGWTALHEAALLGEVGIVQVLLSHGANASDKKDDGKTPLDIAVEKDHQHVVSVLQN
ncbi:ankyrin repeat domain-containing protein [Microbacteriaceae bacterium 4G12]